jgi:hypothetical protein
MITAGLDETCDDLADVPDPGIATSTHPTVIARIRQLATRAEHRQAVA